LTSNTHTGAMAPSSLVSLRRPAHQVGPPRATRRPVCQACLMDDQGATPFCYLTTTGRVSGRPHTIEIWFALSDRTLYVLSGGGDRSDWVRNLLRRPEVTVRLGRRDAEALAGRARVVEPGSDEDELARRLVVAKYQPTYGGDLSGWRRSALPVAVDLTPQAG
jgi:deazaflavin-dependent oxidoreductase (nitroreductase family)